MNVLAGTSTSSPGPMPAAMKAEAERVEAAREAGAGARSAEIGVGSLEQAHLGAVRERARVDQPCDLRQDLVPEAQVDAAQVDEWHGRAAEGRSAA